MDRTKKNFSENITALFYHVLTAIDLFQLGQPILWLDEVAVESNKPRDCKLLLEAFENTAFCSAPTNSATRYRYEDDIFTI